jgi:hypothetical protein
MSYDNLIAVFDTDSREHPTVLCDDPNVAQLLLDLIRDSADVAWDDVADGVRCAGRVRPADVAALRDAADEDEHDMAVPLWGEAATLRALADALERWPSFAVVSSVYAWSHYS